MEQETNIEQLFTKAVDYAETRINLIKLHSIDKSSQVVSSIAWRVFLVLFVLTSLLFVNIGAAFWIGELLGHVYYGFFIIAAFYLFIGLIIYLMKNSIVKNPVRDLIIRKFLN
jgi:hypothetical protein